MSKTTGQPVLFDLERISANWFSEVTDFFSLDNEPGWPDILGDKLRAWFEHREKINTLSLFSGGGGLDIAFRDSGFNIVECIEINKSFTETLEANLACSKKLCNTKITCVDIRDYIPSHKNIDFIIGGPPCQTFSAAGARAAGVKGLDDKRGTLFEEYVRIVTQLQPKGFLFENVYRIVGAQGGKPWQKIKDAFQDAGYKLYWRIVDAADYGVPQHRERLIIVGLKESEFLFPCPTHGPDSGDNRPYYTAGTAVSGLDTSHCKIGINGRHGHLLNDIPPGLNYSFYTEKLGHPNPVFGWRSKFSDYLYKADPDSPVRTVKAQGGQYTGPFSWKNRHFTVAELKRLQTFPDDYKITGNRQEVIAQLGNSVPPQFARILALAVIDQVFKEPLPFKVQYMPSDQELGFRKRKARLTKIYAEKAEKTIATLRNSGRITENAIKPSSGTSTQYLTDGIVLSDTGHGESIAFDFVYDINKSRWDINLEDKKADPKDQFQVKVTLSPALSSILGTKVLLLNSNTSNSFSLVALWKFLEKKVKELAHKDDLVQLFGYYQYRQESVYEFIFMDDKLKQDSFWKIIAQIVSGVAVGVPLHISAMSNIYGIDENRLVSSLKKLKQIGYEVRNHNTNTQLHKDYYLIPYPFATLNERSLQRLTNL